MGPESQTGTRRPIVLIFLGKRLPRYLIQNIRFLCNTQERPIILVADSSSSLLPTSCERFRFVDAKDFVKGWASSHQSRYRDFFWEKTILRLYVLCRFIQTEGISECIHIEGDVWISPYANLDFELDKGTCMYPEMSDHRGIGSIMFIHNLDNQISTEIQSFLQRYPNQTDMQLLGTMLEMKPSIFRVLNSIPRAELVQTDLFDGAEFGMHLFGEHARNRFGRYRLFHQYQDLQIDWSKIRFEVDEQCGLSVVSDKKKFKLNSLHLHSKTSRLFTQNWNYVLAEQVKRREKYGKGVTMFSPLGFMQALWDYSKLLIPYLRKKLH